MPGDMTIAAADPAVGNDATVGFVPGSRWVNATAVTVWECLSAATGAAVWQKLSTAVTTVTSSQQSGTGSSAYTLALTDQDTVVEMTGATAATVTVPPNSSVAFPVGTIIEIHQYGAGQVTMAAGAGVTLRNPSSLTTRAQYSTIGLRQRAANEWVVSGDLT